MGKSVFKMPPSSLDEAMGIDQNIHFCVMLLDGAVAVNANFSIYNVIDIPTDEEYAETIKNIKEKAFIFLKDKKPKNQEKLLTLSTCEYSRNNGRMVVVCKREQ